MEKYFFYLGIIAILGFVAMVTTCTVQTSTCQREAIKANIAPDKIRDMCRLS